MTKESLKLILGIALGIFFLILVIVTIIISQKDKKKPEKKSKDKKKDLDYHEAYSDTDLATPSNKGYWVNKFDLEGITDPVKKLRCHHYFDAIDECINDLIIEMYDCGIVKTEEIYRTAYGSNSVTVESILFQLDIDPDSFKEQLPPVSEEAQKNIYAKWTSYVEDLFEQIEINSSEKNINTIKDALMVYGRKDISILLSCPDFDE